MIVGFNLTKINVEKKKPIKGKIQITHDLTINKVTQQSLPTQEKKQALVFDFTFTINYEPAIGDITLGGNIIYFNEDIKTTESIQQAWKKNKKIPSATSVEVLNVIFARCNIKALELSTDLGLPSHLPLPRINRKEDPTSYI